MILAFWNNDKWLEVIRRVLQNGASELKLLSLSFAKGIWLPQLDLIMTAMINNSSVLACLFLRNLNKEIGFMHLCGWKELQFLLFLITNLSPDNLKLWSNCKSRWLPQSPSIWWLLSKKNINQNVKRNFSTFIFRMILW